ncbi:CinA family protein [Patescibacteria group bacterium]
MMICAEELVIVLKEKGLKIAFMESCTGGSMAGAITDVPGASEVFEGSLVTYSNKEKVRYEVPQRIIDQYTVYSLEVAVAMATAASYWYDMDEDITVGVTGSLSRVDPANPENSTPGEVYFAIYKDCKEIYSEEIIAGGRTRRESKEEIIDHVFGVLLRIL